LKSIVFALFDIPESGNTLIVQRGVNFCWLAMEYCIKNVNVSSLMNYVYATLRFNDVNTQQQADVAFNCVKWYFILTG